MPGAPAASESNLPSPVSRAGVLAEVGLIFTLFFMHGAWPVPEVNETHYLAKAKHFWQPDWCPGDYFLNTRDAHQTFYWTFGWVTRWLSLPAAAWCGRLVTWGLLAWCWQRLSAAVAPGRLASVLSAALFTAMTFRAHLAGEWVIGGVEAKGFAFAALFVGLARLATQRWNAAWLWLGLASAFHVVIGGWAVIAAAAVWCSLGRARPSLPSMLPVLAGGFLLSLPGLAPGLALSYGVDAATVDAANRIYVFERLPHHLVIYRLPGWFVQRHLMLIAAWAIIAWLARAATTAHDPDRARNDARGASTPSCPAPLAMIDRFVLACIGIAVVGGLITAITLDRPDLAARLLRYYWFRMTDFVTPLGLGLSTAALLSSAVGRATRTAAGIERAPARCWLPAALAAAIGVAGYHFGELIYSRMQLRNQDRYCAPADARVPELPDWISACRWVASEPSIAPDARFLTPRAAQSFRWYAQRAEVVSNKDIPQDAAGIVAWWERLQDVHRGGTHREPSPWHASLSELTTARLLALGEKYGADYLITAAHPPLDLPRIGPNDLAYAIYRLAPAGLAARSARARDSAGGQTEETRP